MIKGVEKKWRSGQLLHYRNYKIAPYLVIGVKILLIVIFNSPTCTPTREGWQDKSFSQNSFLIEAFSIRSQTSKRSSNVP